MPSSSFAARQLNNSTFVITEDDAYGEHPLIYVKIHPDVPLLIIGDTGCDKATKHKTHARFTHLREYLEKCPLSWNNNSPLNPGGRRQYLLIISHCHYDHTLGVPQFLRGGQTEIVASAAGRDFIESDLAGHGLYRPIGEPVQPWKVTHWAQAFEKLQWPLKTKTASESIAPKALGITILHTPGHTPDELAWYDHDEMHFYVGDSFYERGPDGMDIIFPPQGNLIEWVFSMQKLRCLVHLENSRAASTEASEDKDDDWVRVPRRVKVGCGHQTAGSDGESIMGDLDIMWGRVLRGEVPVVETEVILGETTDRWMEPGGKGQFSFRAPRRLMLEARSFFAGSELGGDT